MSLRHFLFDFDGTLVDSAPLHAMAFRKALAIAAPESLTEFEYESLKGLSTRTAFLRMGIAPDARLERCVAEKQKSYRDAVRSGGVKEFPGARSLLNAILADGGTNYLVTSGSPESVNLLLDELKLGFFFSGIITAADVSAGKPDAEPYLVCLQRFELRLDETVAIEDAPSGASSAKAAGLRVIGVHNPGVARLSDYYFPTLSALDAALRKRVERLLLR